MIATIYARVSTDGQEATGTSLNSQREACLAKAKELGYDVPPDMIISESISGATLDRPGLSAVMNWVKRKEVDAAIVFDPDRLARDFVLLMVLANEMDKFGTELIFVTQSVGKTPEDKMLFGMRGLFAEYERAKIRSRTLQGRKARAKQGGMSGGFHTTFGYDYQKANGRIGGHRTINEYEASWVRQIYQWLVIDGLTTGAMRDKLMANNVSTKSGRPWIKTTILGILKNPAYCGRTYAFTTIKEKKRSKPQSEWIEIDNATPAIVSQDVFDAAQKQLQVNRERAARNTRRQYLLGGHIRCRQCGYSYAGSITTTKRTGDEHYCRIYRCLGKWKENVNRRGARCQNKTWRADALEATVWAELERYLNKPELILKQLGAQKDEVNQLSGYEIELEQIERQSRTLDREQKELLDNALRGFPESLIVIENKKINSERETLNNRKADLEARIKASKDVIKNIPKLEDFIKGMQSGLSRLDYEGKRMALDMLGITVWLNGKDVEITGSFDIEPSVIVNTHS